MTVGGLMLATLLVTIGVRGRQGLKYWGYCLTAMTVHAAAALALYPRFTAARLAAPQNHPSSALWLAFALLALCYAVPVGIAAVGFRRPSR
jgi:hypothetical protein